MLFIMPQYAHAQREHTVVCWCVCLSVCVCFSCMHFFRAFQVYFLNWCIRKMRLHSQVMTVLLTLRANTSNQGYLGVKFAYRIQIER